MLLVRITEGDEQNVFILRGASKCVVARSSQCAIVLCVLDNLPDPARKVCDQSRRGSADTNDRAAFRSLAMHVGSYTWDDNRRGQPRRWGAWAKVQRSVAESFCP